MATERFSDEDKQSLIELIEWYRDDYFTIGMKQICDDYVSQLQSVDLTQETYDMIELIVDMWID